jgi:hypothetical protein
LNRSQLFAKALSIFAGLSYRCEHNRLLDIFLAAADREEGVVRARELVLHSSKPDRLAGLSEAKALADKIDVSRSLFVFCDFGSLHVALKALQHVGLKPAVVFETLDPSTVQLAENLGITLVDFRSISCATEAFRTLRDLQKQGFAVALRADAKGQGRETYDFLGYQVRCSRLVEVYARWSGSDVFPIVATLVDKRRFAFRIDDSFYGEQCSTRSLLSRIDDWITNDPEDYNWTTSSMVFSDQAALINGLMRMPIFLDWLAKARTRTRKALSVESRASGAQ